MSTFNCQACIDDTPIEQMVLVAGDSLCQDCFIVGYKSQFVSALKSEIDYPPHYASEILDIDDFPSFFDPDFIRAYKVKVKEYTTPIPDRLYCNNNIETRRPDFTMSHAICSNFLGTKAAPQDKGTDSILCSSCSSHVCTSCADQMPGDQEEHTCGAVIDGLENQTRGVDYQICPACQFKISLRDGCNHMTCRCGHSFCYICGKSATFSSGHWDPGNPCPRYSQPRTEPGRIYDIEMWQVRAQ
ncbi:uncharacterized protein RCC_02532 [Ramularia collo-cygni]|uniref:RING-type domain-containing protein n=1 Tax=Ramularia collo-cygni TaxID=112498 RepID=A0A2D3UWR9_9PEZI|nr:uncharacterized protein RCC_02532 [Ramularia collo-cygni]CZT16697.1 uncharacterized protein RCC_02532 [Ramularia collo-cygni]